MADQQYPLYHPEMEHESCGVGAIVDMSGRATHHTVDQALTIVERLAHRAGSDALGTTGDGVGITCGTTSSPRATCTRASRWWFGRWRTAGRR